jgi:hypothetical protein
VCYIPISPEADGVGTGLCSFGIAGKAVLEKYGRFKDIKVRFSGVALPGETLVTSLWKEGNRVYLSASALNGPWSDVGLG